MTLIGAREKKNQLDHLMMVVFNGFNPQTQGQRFQGRTHKGFILYGKNVKVQPFSMPLEAKQNERLVLGIMD